MKADMSDMAPMKAAEIVVHPEFPYVNWNITPSRKERIVVGRDRGGPFRIAFEIHGKGPIRMVVSFKVFVKSFQILPVPMFGSIILPDWEILGLSQHNASFRAQTDAF
jgi:hypothetical protein